MKPPEGQTCNHPECHGAENLLGIGGTIGPLHEALEALSGQEEEETS